MSSSRTMAPAARRTVERGFTLIELLIAITVAFILMGMAAFALIRARANANEASAIASMKAINQAQISYNAACGASFYAPSLVVLGMPPHAAATGGYIDPELATGAIVERSGYRIAIAMGAGGFVAASPDCNGNMPISAYYATAIPIVVGETGTRAFATSQVGAIWQRSDGIAPAEPFGSPAQVAE